MPDTARRLFALDHNFPDPIVAVLADFQADADLVRIDQIDARLPDLDDWELLLVGVSPLAGLGRPDHHRQQHAEPGA